MTGSIAPGTTGTPGLAHPPASLGLVAHGADGRGGRADEDETGALDRLGERGALGQESVAGVDRVGAGLARGLDQPLDAKVALGGRRRADGDGEVGGADVGAGPVGGGVDRHRLETFLVAGADDSQRDLAAVGDQDPLHRAGFRDGMPAAACLRRGGGDCCRGGRCGGRRRRRRRGLR